jgi:hypothetical protein
MSNRIVNAEVNRYNVDVYLVAAAYRCEVRDPEENIVLSATASDIDGDGGVLESIETYFTATREPTLGKALVESARMELAANGCAPRRAVDGIRLTGIIVERLRKMSAPDVPADIRLPPMDDDTRLLIAGHAATAIKLACACYERNPR